MARVVTRRSRRPRDAAPAWIDARACVDRSIDRDPGSEPSMVAGISMLRWHRRRWGASGGPIRAAGRTRSGRAERRIRGPGRATVAEWPGSSPVDPAARVMRHPHGSTLEPAWTGASIAIPGANRAWSQGSRCCGGIGGARGASGGPIGAAPGGAIRPAPAARPPSRPRPPPPRSAPPMCGVAGARRTARGR